LEKYQESRETFPAIFLKARVGSVFSKSQLMRLFISKRRIWEICVRGQQWERIAFLQRSVLFKLCYLGEFDKWKGITGGINGSAGTSQSCTEITGIYELEKISI
jgi:hypothetical protein